MRCWRTGPPHNQRTLVSLCFLIYCWFSAISFRLGGVCLPHISSAILSSEIASRDLIDVVENNNVSLAQGFINTTWKTYGEQMKNGTELVSALPQLAHVPSISGRTTTAIRR